jgi:hypothetical protein
MHLLRSRLDGGVKRLNEIEQAFGTQLVELEWQLDSLNDEMKMLAEILPAAPTAGMRFANELYICRHLLTQARIKLRRCARVEGVASPSPNQVRQRDTSLARAASLYMAASATLRAAEDSLPGWTTDIDGEPFWDRFIRVAGEREAAAERQRLDEQRRRN